MNVFGGSICKLKKVHKSQHNLEISFYAPFFLKQRRLEIFKLGLTLTNLSYVLETLRLKFDPALLFFQTFLCT